MNEPWFPNSADLNFVIVFFIILTATFHFVFVWWLKLDKIGWKRAEYVCLVVGTVGIFGAVTQVRVSVASSQTVVSEQRSRVAFESLQSLVEMLAKRPGAVCRTFIRSEYSPPPEVFERSQNEYNQACEWLNVVTSRIPHNMPSPPAAISATSFPPPPATSSVDLKDIIDGFYKQLRHYNETVDVYNVVRKKTQNDDFENILMLLSPYLLAIALALSLAKVTGEIRLERRPPASS